MSFIAVCGGGGKTTICIKYPENSWTLIHLYGAKTTKNTMKN